MKKSNSFNAIIPNVSKGILVASILVLSTFGMLSASNAVAASGYTHYVTDSIKVPVRSGPSYKHKIHRMLETGTPVSILEVNKDGWSQIQYKIDNSTYTGWMASSTLLNQPVAKVRLEQQIAKTSSVEKKLNELQQELSTLQTRFTITDSALSTIKQEKFELTQALTHLKTISSNSVLLDKQNQDMKQRLSQLESQNAIMTEQIEQSGDSLKRQWFLTGGGVLLLGLLLGRFFRTPNKRKKWGEI
ncbi:TIGR04211 family SH3 domain-containing protein [Thiomicrorhabdus arctica]|uniref:TIGR04211 family SH3 domain-containing protein n=1 Tax=Thiomicrorhabdus arctica TaxID=131540 RepID=UPI00037D5BD5|nr:TIGR04211 family SH3 domain-containing protein [Thiomicrorhabdus arctica]